MPLRSAARSVERDPTFVTFNPWITLAGYRDLLSTILDLGLVGNVSPIQYAIRLLIPRGSRLLELPLVQEFVGDFDPAALAYPWTHPDPRVDRLHADVLAVVGGNQTAEEDRFAIFARVWELTEAANEAPPSDPYALVATGVPQSRANSPLERTLVLLSGTDRGAVRSRPRVEPSKEAFQVLAGRHH